MSVCREDQLYLIGVNQTCVRPNLRRLTFRTTRGDFNALAHFKKGVRQGAIELGDRPTGLDGPGSIFPQLANELLDHGIGSLRLAYRSPGDCAQSAIDVLLALQYLDDEGIRDVVLVGWSFGGAVALWAGSLGKTVRGIAAISTTDVADCCLRLLGSRPLLLLHGDSDTISPVDVSRRVYFKSGEPHRLIVYPGAGHGFDEVRDQLRSDLRSWVINVLHSPPVAA